TSAQAGLARAIVSRDVRGYDGTKVLIPRGSRLIGEYRSEVAPGQNRAVIVWTRLMLPDGVIVSLNSPTVDPMGRGGIRASVNSHLLERVTGALLQTTMGLGNVLTRGASGNVIVAMPNTETGNVSPTSSTQVTPTRS